MGLCTYCETVKVHLDKKKVYKHLAAAKELSKDESDVVGKTQMKCYFKRAGNEVILLHDCFAWILFETILPS